MASLESQSLSSYRIRNPLFFFFFFGRSPASLRYSHVTPMRGSNSASDAVEDKASHCFSALRVVP